MTGLKASLKSTIPPSLWEAMRSAWYAAGRVRFLKAYLPGLLFDVFQKDYTTEGMSFAVPRHLTTRIHRARFYWDTHEKDERDLVRKHVPADARVLELGACLGVVSCVINRLLHTPAQHVAVEANPALAGILNENRTRNRCAFAVEICMVSRTSDGTFYQNECLVMSSGHMRQGKRIEVPVMSVEALEERHGFAFDTVFMDIQGGELEFMRENRPLLDRCRLMILEVHPHIIGDAACEECRALLTASGLRLQERRGLVEVWAAGRDSSHG